jgi:hypothetical protein
MKTVQLQLILIVFTIIFATGCGPNKQLHKNIKSASTEQLRTSSKLASIREQNIPELKRGQTVYIQNYYSKPEIVGLGFASSSIAIDFLEIGTDGYKIDLRQFTKTSMVMLSKALKQRDIENVKTGFKQVKLRAHSVKYDQGAFSATIEVSVTAELGSSKSITASEERSSASNLAAAASAAVSDATRKILNHPDFIQYINQ